MRKVSTYMLLIVSGYFIVSLAIGLMTPEPMIGDEVTHYFMLAEQSRDLTRPNFTSVIPVSYGDPIERQYAHSFGWHYLGALAYRISGGRYAAVQLYHGLFWIQLLVASYLLAASRGGDKTGVSLLYTVLMASLPMCILFSVALYQEIPVTAQIVTAFLLLSKGRWLLAIGFMAFALWLKVSAFVAFPIFIGMLLWHVWRRDDERHAGSDARTVKARMLRTLLAGVVSLVLLGGASWGLGWALQRYANADFYPVVAARRIVKQADYMKQAWVERLKPSQKESVEQEESHDQKPSKDRTKHADVRAPRRVYDVIANHPGDLRFARNWLLYFGGVVWVVTAVGLLGWGMRRKRRLPDEAASAGWLWVVGLGYILPTAYILRTAPDARFFLPAIPFLLLPLCEQATAIPCRKWVFTGLIAVSLLQSSAVYHKTYQLRNVPEGIHEAIRFLEANLPAPSRIFMYPEGNYRLFPADHEWYLGYGLRDFWRGDNNFRIEMLNRRRVGAVVVKKHLVAPLDPGMHNLGVYPPAFVADLRADPRFEKGFENESAIIFYVPPAPVHK